MSLSISVIIVAGGSGSRMKSMLPKQFLKLAGKPLLMHTIEKFYTTLPEARIIVVLPEAHIKLWSQLCLKHPFVIKHTLIAGGETRYNSVKNGLSLITGEGITVVHDAVRPFVSAQVILNCIAMATEKGNAIPVIPLKDSLRESDGITSKSVNRNFYKAVQTPQCFRNSIISDAYKTPYRDIFTDDASVLEYCGYTLNLCEGNEENFKITTPFDFIVAETFLKKQSHSGTQ